MQQNKANSSKGLIEEVRAIRRAIVAEHGNDVDRLCDHLKQVERDYRAHSGVFSLTDSRRMEQVIASGAMK